MELTTVWFALIAVLWVGYFCLEGFDFGVGMLLPVLARNETERRVMINTIGPVWDGNEVWVLVAGGATFAAFPEWYATLFSGFYLPLLLILVALIVRGLAFEYRHKRDDDALEGPLGPRHHLGLVRAGPALGRRLRQHRRRRADRRRQGVHRHPLHPAQPLRPAGRARHADASSPPTARCSSRSRPTATSATAPATWPCGSARSPPCSPWSSWSWTQMKTGTAVSAVVFVVAALALVGGLLAAMRRPGGLGVRRHLRHDRPRRRRPVRGAVPRRDALDHRPGVLAHHHQRRGDGVHAEGDDVGRGGLHPDRPRLPGVDLLGVPQADRGAPHPGGRAAPRPPAS